VMPDGLVSELFDIAAVRLGIDLICHHFILTGRNCEVETAAQ
jgi:hypothetical protein